MALPFLESQISQDIKPHRELRREAPQLSMGFDFCPNITDYSSSTKLKPKNRKAALCTAFLFIPNHKMA